MTGRAVIEEPNGGPTPVDFALPEISPHFGSVPCLSTAGNIEATEQPVCAA